ncbi:MAG: hypothetical protein H7Y59_16890 [Anaerolineales bacterium]|nr:hypothetical protein [Anaerolineales bacterium]
MTNQLRQKPGSSGMGDYYHVEVLPKSGFVTFRTQDVGTKGHIQRVTGKRASGSWATVKWLIGKEDAHLSSGKLVADTKDAKDLIKQLGIQPIHLSGDRFKAKVTSADSKSAKPAPAKKTKKAPSTKRPSAKK